MNATLKVAGAAGAATLGTFVVPSAPVWLSGLVTVVGCAVVVISAVFPQESGDRLEWWRHMFPRAGRREALGVDSQADDSSNIEQRARQGSNLRPTA